MSDFHAPDTGKRSLWERPMTQPDAPQASYQGNQQAYQEPYQYPQDQAKGWHSSQQGYDQGYAQGGQAYGQQQQPQVVYVKDRKKDRRDGVALGFCAGCATGMCCCGCTVM